jgi:acetoin utilization deacetylase AcuC-like enzyme
MSTTPFAVPADLSPARRTGLAWDELLMWHGQGPVSPAGGSDLWVEPGDFGEETAPPRRRLHNLLVASGMTRALAPLAFGPASQAQLEAVHTREYVARIEAESAVAGGMAGEVTPFGPGAFTIASLAAGGCVGAVDAVMTGEVDNAYALVRPAGHHAVPDAGRGYCIFANAAIAARQAQRAHGTERIAIIDWDVHHGNGTQAVFWDDPDVLTISLHQADWYPRGEGGVNELGGGDGYGHNVNVPLPPGSGIGAYRYAFEHVVLPAVRGHAPDLVIVSCGFDASGMDSAGRMLLTSEDFRQLTRMCREAAHDLCQGRLVLCHEGGYHPLYVPFCGLAVIEELAGCPSGVRDPFLRRYTGVGYESLQSHQRAVVDELRGVLEHAGTPLAA